MKYTITFSFLLVSILSYSTVSIASCIGFVTVSGGVFWSEVDKGALKAAKELGIKIYMRSPIDEANINGQKNIIEAAISFGCKGFVIAPNSKQVNEISSQLKTQNIPTVYIDRDYGGDRLSIISTNNYLAGAAAGREMVKALNGKGRVAVFRLSKKVVSTTLREKGFIDQVTKEGLEVVVDQYIGARVGKARENSLEILQSMDDIDGIFTPNETTTLGVLINRQKLNNVNKVVHIGFDSHKRMIDALETNFIDGFIVQNPYQMGYKSVHNVYKAMKGQMIESIIDTGVVFVNKNNINTKKIKEILNIQ